MSARLSVANVVLDEEVSERLDATSAAAKLFLVSRDAVNNPLDVDGDDLGGNASSGPNHTEAAPDIAVSLLNGESELFRGGVDHSNVVLLLNKAVWRSGSRNGQDGGNQTSEAHVCWSEGLEKELGVAFVDCFLS